MPRGTSGSEHLSQLPDSPLPRTLALPDSCWGPICQVDLRIVAFVRRTLEHHFRNLTRGTRGRKGRDKPAKDHFYFGVLKQRLPGCWACRFVILSQLLPVSCKCAIIGNLAAITVKCPLRAASVLTDHWPGHLPTSFGSRAQCEIEIGLELDSFLQMSCLSKGKSL